MGQGLLKYNADLVTQLNHACHQQAVVYTSKEVKFGKVFFVLDLDMGIAMVSEAYFITLIKGTGLLLKPGIKYHA